MNLRTLFDDFKDSKINAKHRQFDRKLSLLSFFTEEQKSHDYTAPPAIPKEVLKPLIMRADKTQTTNASVGDSYVAFMAGKISMYIPTDSIYNIPGTRARQILQVIRTLGPLLRKGGNRNLFVGTTGGNDLLQYQPIDAIRSDVRAMLSAARQELPTSKIIVVGVPPVYRVYADKYAPVIEADCVKWMIEDSNAVFVSLRQLAGFAGMFPKAKFSSDGIHASPQGVEQCAELFRAALRSTPGRVL